MTRSVMVQQRQAHWRERLADQARSGLGVVAFCEKEGIATKTFYGWRARLQDSGGRQRAAQHRDRNPRAVHRSRGHERRDPSRGYPPRTAHKVELKGESMR